MRGQRPILEAARSAAGRGETAVLATVVRVSGSAYRRPGARMLFPASGPPVGFVSGGCLEADLAERAAAVAAAGAPTTVVYDMRSPDDIVWGLGLGCNGEVRVLLERVDAEAQPAWIERVLAAMRARRRSVLVTVFEGPDAGARLVLDGGEVVAGPSPGPLRDDLQRAARETGDGPRLREVDAGRGAALVEVLEPPVRLIVCGAGSDAAPLVAQARALDWEVEVVDRREGHARSERFPGAAAVRVVDFGELGSQVAIDRRTPVVVMTHHFLDDATLLQALLPCEAPYIGLIGPAARRMHLLEELARRGVAVAADALDRLYGPVGLDVGSETPEEIALAVVAEIRAVLSGRSGGFLRDRRGPLHDAP